MSALDTTEQRKSDSASPRLRIAQVLEGLKKDKGSYSKLERAIKVAVEHDTGPVPVSKAILRGVDRRKLKAIVEDDPKLVLSVSEIIALDKYLEPLGHGLAYNPFLLKPELMLRLAESGQIAFLLGSKPDPLDPFRINISHWDFLGLNSIQEKVLGCSQKKVLIDIREVRMRTNLNRARMDLDDEKLLRPFDEDGPSIVCMASSISNLMTEWMLCRMAKQKEFTRTAKEHRPELPFEFVWSRPREFVISSQFHLPPEEARLENQKFGNEILAKNASGLRYAGGCLIDDMTIEDKTEGYTYAVCVAQRRERGQIWLLVAGLTGLATYAASKWVHNMATPLHDAKPGTPSRVFWNIVRAKAVKVTESGRVAHRVDDAEVVAGGVAWS